MIISMSVSLILRAEVVQKYENMSTLPSPRSKLPSVRSSVHYASCTINHAKIKIFGDYYIVISICINYFKNRTKTWPFVHPEPHSYPTASTFGAPFVDGIALQPPPVQVLAPFCGRHGTLTTSRTGLGPVLWTASFWGQALLWPWWTTVCV